MRVQIAWRNIWRNRRRSLLTMLAITFSSSILIFFMALQLSLWESTTKASISSFTGALQIQRKGYLDKPEIRTSFAVPQSIDDFLISQSLVDAYTKRGIGFALLSSKDRTYGVQITGVIPEREKLVSSIAKNVRSGTYLTAADGQGIVIGTPLARNLKVALGDEITLLGQGRDGSLAATVLKLEGTFESGVQDLDRAMAFMRLDSFQDTFGMENSVHSVVISTSQLTRLDELKSLLSRNVSAAGNSKLIVLDWSELMPGIKQAIELDMTFGWLFYFSLVLIVVLLVLNTFLMSVLERTKEFGLMLALGMVPAAISKLVVIECLLLTLLGLFGGIIIGSSVTYYFSVRGFYIPGSEEIMKIWNVPVEAYPQISLMALTLIPAVLLLLTIIAVIYPAARVFRLKAVEAMRAT